MRRLKPINQLLFKQLLYVVLSSIAAGIGAISLGASNFLMAPLLSLISWYVWAYLIYFIGAKIFPEKNTQADHGQLLRTIGFSSAPGLIRIFGFYTRIDEYYIYWIRYLDVVSYGYCCKASVRL